MEKSPENFNAAEQETIWDNRNVQRFLEFRNIKEEDRGLIKEIIDLGDSYEFAEYHNFFSGYKEKSEIYLDHRTEDLKKLLEDENSPDYMKQKFQAEMEFIEKFKELLSKYDWYAAHHLLRLVEDKLGD